MRCSRSREDPGADEGAAKAWGDRRHTPALEQDWRYTRLLNLTKDPGVDMPAGEDCDATTVTVRNAAGNETSIDRLTYGGAGDAGTLPDNEDDGQTG